MGWIKRSDISADLVDRIFDASEGSILEPFQSSGGWEIVLVTASRLPPDSTFALQRDDLLSSMKQQRAERIRRELVQEVQKKYPLTIVHEALPTADQDLRALPGDERTVVGKVGPRDITLQELKAFVLSVSRRKNTPPERGVAKMASYLTVLSGEKAVHAAAIEEGLPGSDAVDALVWNTRQDFVARLFSAEYLKEVPVSEAALALFHEKNPKLFRAPNELTVRIIEADTPKQLQDAVQDLKLGTPFGTLRKKYDVRRLHGGDPVPLDFSSPPPEIPPSYLRALATAPRGAWMGPFQAPTGIRAYEVVSSQEGGIRPVEEVGEELRRVYLSKRGEELLAAYLDGDGRKDIPVEILVEAP